MLPEGGRQEATAVRLLDVRGAAITAVVPEVGKSGGEVVVS